MSKIFSNHVEISKANESDISEILFIEKLCFDANHFPITSRKHLKYLISSPSVEFLVLKNNQNNILGTLIIFFRKNSAAAKINSLAIHPDFQRHGFGKLLFAAAENAAIKKECNQIILEVRQDNWNAINFYTKLNFEKHKILPKYYPDGMDGIKMKKILKM